MSGQRETARQFVFENCRDQIARFQPPIPAVLETFNVTVSAVKSFNKIGKVAVAVLVHGHRSLARSSRIEFRDSRLPLAF